MKEIRIRIEGKTPLLCNRFTDEAQMQATEGSRSSMNGDSGTARENAEKKLYVSEEDGSYVIPQPNLFRCIIDAGKFFKSGKSKVTTQKTSLIPACVDMPDVEYQIQPQTWETELYWEVDTRPVRIPATGGRLLCHRPMFREWVIEFTAILDDSMIGERLFRELLDKAGSAIGLGDFRPDCKGPFGKFVVTKWERQEQPEAA